MADLPNAPDIETRTGMACAFIESADYDGGLACASALAAIRAGCMIFTLPDRLQITREGMAVLQSSGGK